MSRTIYYICFTSYHLFYAAYLAYQRKEDSCEHVLIWRNAPEAKVQVELFNHFFQRIICVQDYDRRINGRKRIARFVDRCVCAGWLFPFTAVSKEIRTRTNCCAVYCFSDQECLTNRIIRCFKNKEAEVILVDEGVGMYSMKSKQGWRAKLVNRMIGVRTEPYIGNNSRVNTFLARYPEKLSNEKVRGRRVMKLENAFWDAAFLEYFNALLARLSFTRSSEKTALWMGQPLGDGRVIDHDKELQWIHEVANVLGPQYVLMIKKHPRDRENKYEPLKNVKNIKVLEMGEYTWVPAELIVSALNPSMVLSAHSSAGDFLAERNVKVVYCFEMMGISVDDAARNALKGENRFLISSLAQLKEIVDEENNQIDI